MNYEIMNFILHQKELQTTSCYSPNEVTKRKGQQRLRFAEINLMIVYQHCCNMLYMSSRFSALM